MQAKSDAEWPRERPTSLWSIQRHWRRPRERMAETMNTGQPKSVSCVCNQHKVTPTARGMNSQVHRSQSVSPWVPRLQDLKQVFEWGEFGGGVSPGSGEWGKGTSYRWASEQRPPVSMGGPSLQHPPVPLNAPPSCPFKARGWGVILQPHPHNWRFAKPHGPGERQGATAGVGVEGHLSTGAWVTTRGGGSMAWDSRGNCLK